jgi:hypothetical protein
MRLNVQQQGWYHADSLLTTDISLGEKKSATTKMAENFHTGHYMKCNRERSRNFAENIEH